MEERGEERLPSGIQPFEDMFEAYLLVTQRFSLCGGAMRDDTKNGFVADFRKFYPMNSGPG